MIPISAKAQRLILFVLLACAIYPSFAITKAAEIVSLQGKGEYRLPPNSQWMKAAIKQELQASSLVRTGDLSNLGLLFIDQTQIRLGPNSMFQIKQVESNGRGKTILKLKKGKSWSRSKRANNTLLLETPSGIAAIHGTDWLIEVDEQGVSTLTVLDGKIQFSNKQGAVIVGKNEQATAAPGHKPIKKQLITPKERVQWINTHSVRLDQYPSLKTHPLPVSLNVAIAALREEQFAAARIALEQTSTLPSAPAETWLLLADIALMEGDWKLANDWLKSGASSFKDDARFSSRQVRLLILQDQMEAARTKLDVLLNIHPNDAEVLLVQGSLAHLEGEFNKSISAFSAVTVTHPNEPRGWLGAGMTYKDRDDYKPAYDALIRAVKIDPSFPGLVGELATLETQADQLTEAELLYDSDTGKSDDFVTLAGLGVLYLKQGKPKAALETLLKASIIKPNYARALLYTAVAYYQLGRSQHALDLLYLAIEADPRDPTPHLMESLIHQDQIKPLAAIAAARRAQERMPFLKSVNQLAHDKKGSANTGSALALMGLESWATAYAQDSYHPFWAGSHLFLANRYQGRYLRESELMQGYLTDPTFFGASPRNQSLIQRPEQHLGVGLGIYPNADFRTIEPTFISNGFHNDNRPWAYFIEAIGQSIEPGDLALGAKTTNITAAWGAKPTPDLGLFIFGNYLSVNLDNPGEAIKHDLQGYESRIDAGFRYRFSSDSYTWAKIGVARANTQDRYLHPTTSITGECSPVSPFSGFCETELKPENEDLAIRHTFRTSSNHQLSLGLELAREQYDNVYTLDGESQVGTNSVDELLTSKTKDQDRSNLFYISDRWQVNRDLLLQFDITHMNYRKTQDSTAFFTTGGIITPVTLLSDDASQSDLFPRFGFSYRAQSGLTLRGAYQNWLRPIAPSGLAPVATAGIPLSDQWVLPGGESERTRLQIDWEMSERTFTTVWYDHEKINNLTNGFGMVLNSRQSLAELGRLQQNFFENLSDIETLEGNAYFAKGKIRSIGTKVSHILSDRITAEVGYVHSKGENLSANSKGKSLPLVPKYRFSVGMTWFPLSRLRVQGQMVYRSDRYQDELQNTKLDSGWEGTGALTWSQPDRKIEVSAYARGLFRQDKTSSFGIKGLWRF